MMKPYLPHFALLLFFLFLVRVPSVAQEVTFVPVSPSDDREWGAVVGISQDKQGYMWFATLQGVYRFNGYEMEVYRNDPKDPNTLSLNRTESIHVDRNGIIWIGTFGKGLNRLDPLTGTFTHYLHDPKDKNSLSNDTVTVILEDWEGVLWIGTQDGLNRFHAETGIFTRYVKDADDSTSLSNNQVRALYEDKQGTLWVGTGSPFSKETPLGEGGLNRFDRKTGSFKQYLHDPSDPYSLVDNKVRAIFEDSRGTFWVGTYGDGLHTMDRNKGTFERHRYDPAHPEKLSRPYLREGRTSDGVTFIHEDASGAIWIGSYAGGLNRYDPQTHQVTHYEAGNDQNNFDNNNAWWAFTSRDGVLWISTAWEGTLYKIDPFLKKIPHVNLPSPLLSFSILSFYEDTADILWIGTGNGLFRHDQRTGKIHHFVRDTLDPASLSYNVVTSIYEDRQGKLWIGTERGDLNFFDKKNFRFTKYPIQDTNKVHTATEAIYALYEDKEEALWIGAFEEGLKRLDPKTGVITQYLHDKNNPASISTNHVTHILEDRSGNFWTGNWHGGGVNLLNRKTGSFKRYLQGVNVTGVFEDHEGVLWAATETGLFRFSPAKQSFLPFIDTKTGQSIPRVASITEDHQQNIWLSTHAGLIRISSGRDLVSTYGKKYGVYGRAMNYKASYTGRHGRLYFGDISGYYTFLPAQLKVNRTPPQLILEEFRLFDRSVKAEADGLLRVPLSRAKKIRLDHDENVFAFSFAGIHYSRPEDNQHYYKLENYDNTWRSAGTDRSAAYFKVPPGNYIFKVRAANSDGVWTEKSIALVIAAPWWGTWWAYGLYALVFVCGVMAFIEYRSISLKRENRLLEERVKQRTAEVMAQNDEIVQKNRKIQAQHDRAERALWELQATQAQLIQSEKMASLGELTAGIAHEIQNPLNFVNNFSEVSIEVCEELQQEVSRGSLLNAPSLIEDLSKNLKKIQQHGMRADAIVKGMLQHARSSTGRKEATDINALAYEFLHLSYHGLRAKDKNFRATLVTDFDEELEKVEVIPQEIGRVFLNLFNNAFYAVQQKQRLLGKTYEPEVKVKTQWLFDQVEIRVTDNGMGIPAGVKGKVFQPFFTTKPSGQGTGLGLSLAYEIITKGHGGHLLVESREREYTEFIIQLPVRVSTLAQPSG